MPQVLCQAVEEGGYVTQPVTDLTPQTQHRQAPGLLKVPHVSLCHVTVHEKVKSEAGVKERNGLGFWLKLFSVQTY